MSSDPTTRISVALPKSVSDDFNRDLIASGLRPEHVADLGPITMQIGVWIGTQLRLGVPLQLAIAEIDEVAGSSLETLLDDCQSVAQRIETMMLKAALGALALCCEPGRVVEAATFLVRTTTGLAEEAITAELDGQQFPLFRKPKPSAEG